MVVYAEPGPLKTGCLGNAGWGDPWILGRGGWVVRSGTSASRPPSRTASTAPAPKPSAPDDGVQAGPLLRGHQGSRLEERAIGVHTPALLAQQQALGQHGPRVVGVGLDEPVIQVLGVQAVPRPARQHAPARQLGVQGGKHGERGRIDALQGLHAWRGQGADGLLLH